MTYIESKKTIDKTKRGGTPVGVPTIPLYPSPLYENLEKLIRVNLP